MRFRFEEPLPQDAFGVIGIRVLVGGKIDQILNFPCVFVVADGLEEFNFGVHKSPSFDDDWVVSHVETGFAIAKSYSREEAMVMAAAVLATKSHDDLRKAIAKAHAFPTVQAIGANDAEAKL